MSLKTIAGKMLLNFMKFNFFFENIFSKELIAKSNERIYN